MSRLRAGVIGFGYTGQLHLRAYALSGVEVRAVADRRPDALENVPAGIRRCADHRVLLDADVDVVSICLPTALHAQAALDALAAGKHVLVEKPVATNVAEAEAMMAAARCADRRLFVGMTHRFYPEVLEAKRIVEEGGIGKIVMIRDTVLEHFGFLDSPGWYLEKEWAGGGTALTSGIHLVDRVTWFLGEAPAAVAGWMDNRFLGRAVEDAAQMLLSFRSGRSAQITCGLLAQPHPLVCDLELIGEKGSIVVHTWQGYEYRAAAGSEARAVYTNEPHREKVLVGVRGEVEEFCTAVAEGREPRPSADESTQALRVVMAFYRAAATGKTETVDGLRKGEGDGSTAGGRF